MYNGAIMATISEQLKAAIEASGESKYAIAKASGVKQPTLSKFTMGGRGLHIESVDALCEYLGLELAPKGKRNTSKGTKGKTAKGAK